MSICIDKKTFRSLMKKVLVAQSCLTLCNPHGLQPTRLLCPWDSPGKNTGVGCHSLLQGIFPSQWLNLGLLHCRGLLFWAAREAPFNEQKWFINDPLGKLSQDYNHWSHWTCGCIDRGDNMENRKKNTPEKWNKRCS